MPLLDGTKMMTNYIAKFQKLCNTPKCYEGFDERMYEWTCQTGNRKYNRKINKHKR